MVWNVLEDHSSQVPSMSFSLKYSLVTGTEPLGQLLVEWSPVHFGSLLEALSQNLKTSPIDLNTPDRV